MSVAEIERFAADLKSNEALRGEAEKAHADTSQATSVDCVVAFAASKGYAFTADDMKTYATAKKLTDAELSGIVGGNAEVGALSEASAKLGIDQGKLEVQKGAAKVYGDQFSKAAQQLGH